MAIRPFKWKCGGSTSWNHTRRLTYSWISYPWHGSRGKQISAMSSNLRRADCNRLFISTLLTADGGATLRYLSIYLIFGFPPREGRRHFEKLGAVVWKWDSLLNIIAFLWGYWQCSWAANFNISAPAGKKKTTPTKKNLFWSIVHLATLTNNGGILLNGLNCVVWVDGHVNHWHCKWMAHV